MAREELGRGEKTMTLFQIYTPNSSFSGERAGVVFRAGEGMTHDPLQAEELRRLGYHVLALPDSSDLPAADPPAMNAIVTTLAGEPAEQRLELPATVKGRKARRGEGRHGKASGTTGDSQ